MEFIKGLYQKAVDTLKETKTKAAMGLAALVLTTSCKAELFPSV